MDNRFNSGSGVENGGMFSRQKLQQIVQKVMSNYDVNHDNVLEPADMAKVMIDTYRGMNRHFIPTGYELSTYARVFDKNKKGTISRQDILATATRLFLANQTPQR